MEFRLAVIGDLHYSAMLKATSRARQARDEFYSRLFDHFFAIEADMHVALGDVTHEGHAEEWLGIQELVEQHGIPRNRDFRFILGNHDSLALPKAHALATMNQAQRYSLVETDVCRLIFLDTTKESSRHDWGGIVDEEQIEWLKSFRRLPRKTTLVFGHHPFPRTTSSSDEPMMNIANAEAFKEALSLISGTVMYFNGHNHVHSIAEQAEVDENWSFVQSACPVSAFSFRTVKVSPEQIAVSTVHLPEPEFEGLSEQVRQSMTDFMHHPFARGGKRDQSLVVRCQPIDGPYV